MRNFGKCRLTQKNKILLFLFIFIANPFFWNLFVNKEILISRFFGKLIEIDTTDIYFINERRNYYNNNFIARLNENKVSELVKKYSANFFQGIDPNYYFFANHPRERAGVTEKEKFYFLYFPFFLLGIFNLIKENKYFIFIYFFSFLFFLSFFTDIDTNFILLYPAIIFFITEGLACSINYFCKTK
jgi:hypothetical protein